MTDRRAFLKLLARSAAYAAPVVATYGVPLRVAGQGMSSVHMTGAAPAQSTSPAAAPGSPWTANPPPGRTPPDPNP